MRTREYDRSRKQKEKIYTPFKKLAKLSETMDNFEYFCYIKHNGTEHYTGSCNLKKKFTDNLPIANFTENMIETRRESLLQKINLSNAKKEAVEPSPSKCPPQLSFLPGLNLGGATHSNLKQVQRKELLSLSISPSSEFMISVDNNVHDIRSRIFSREKKVDPAKRVHQLCNAEQEESIGCKRGRGQEESVGCKRGRGRGKRRGRGRGTKKM
jgi:hypothetical protein